MGVTCIGEGIMGTDIHVVAQAKKEGEWVDIPSQLDIGRHYNLFAHLAGVRNGSGFAGCDTGSSVTPIQECRGYPTDFIVDEDDHRGEKWLGEHSHGWVTADEIFLHDWSQGVERGIISIDQYNNWDGGMPESWCGGVFGDSYDVANGPQDITDKTTHVRVSWDRITSDFNYFTNEVMEMVDTYGRDVRIVFGFDS